METILLQQKVSNRVFKPTPCNDLRKKAFCSYEVQIIKYVLLTSRGLKYRDFLKLV